MLNFVFVFNRPYCFVVALRFLGTVDAIVVENLSSCFSYFGSIRLELSCHQPDHQGHQPELDVSLHFVWPGNPSKEQKEKTRIKLVLGFVITSVVLSYKCVVQIDNRTI